MSGTKSPEAPSGKWAHCRSTKWICKECNQYAWVVNGNIFCPEHTGLVDPRTNPGTATDKFVRTR
jgi:hypothetical protein